MKYRVILTENAKANLREYYERAAEQAPGNGRRLAQSISRNATNTLNQPPMSLGRIDPCVLG